MTRRTRRIAHGLGLALATMVLLGTHGCPHEYHVDGAHTGAETGTAAQPFRTVGAAMAVAGSGDTVLVRPGRYREHVRVPDGVTLRSTLTGAAILDGDAGRSGGNPTVTAGDSAVVEGFTVTGGFGGIVCPGTSPTLRRNVVRGNWGDGGIKCLSGCAAVIENNTILGNLGNATNGLAIGIYTEASNPRIANNIVTGNDIGYAPYQSAPAESYNLIGGNRRNFGYSATPGTGTLTSADPGFRAPALDDYRLGATSPARDAGDPAARFNDADGSRNDMGAFDGDGGYRVPIAVQELFAESILGAVDTATGLRTDGTSRFDANPTFWFDATGRGTQGETDARAVLARAVPALTDGAYTAQFRNAAAPPADPCGVITVSFGRPPRGEAFRRGAGPTCRSLPLERSGAAIIGGELDLAGSWTSGFAANASAVGTVLHEVEHVAGVRHSYRGVNVIGQGQGCCQSDYSDEEKAGFDLLYAEAPATTLDRLITDGKITRNALEPFPRIDSIRRWDSGGGSWIDARRTAGGSRDPDYWARPGDWILINGSRLTLRWSTEPRVSFRAPDWAPPEVVIGGAAATVDLDRQSCPSSPPAPACGAGEPSNNFQGLPTRYLKVQVPAGAASGWVVVTARGLTSNPVWLEIR